MNTAEEDKQLTQVSLRDPLPQQTALSVSSQAVTAGTSFEMDAVFS
jgi:hypothetical protein